MGNIFLLAQIWECPNDAAATSNNFGDGWGSQRIREQLVSVQKWRYLTNKNGNTQQTNKQTNKLAKIGDLSNKILGVGRDVHFSTKNSATSSKNCHLAIRKIGRSPLT